MEPSWVRTHLAWRTLRGQLTGWSWAVALEWTIMTCTGCWKNKSKDKITSFSVSVWAWNWFNFKDFFLTLGCLSSFEAVFFSFVKNDGGLFFWFHLLIRHFLPGNLCELFFWHFIGTWNQPAVWEMTGLWGFQGIWTSVVEEGEQIWY